MQVETTDAATAPARRALAFALRWIGTVSGSAIVAALMPLSWIAAAHAAIGLGPLPEGPVVEYLARSTSFLYAALGGLMWLIASDPVRHARLLRLVLVLGFAAAPGLFVLDHRAGLPAWWRMSEGPMVLLICAVLAVLAARAGILLRSGRPDAR